MELTKAKKRITSQKIKGEKLSSIIKRVCIKNEPEEIMSWLVQNNFFNDVFFVIWGIYNSNKWALLKEEIPNYCIKNTHIIELSLCRHLSKKEISVEDLKKTNLSYYEALSIYGFLEISKGKIPITSAGLLNEVNSWDYYTGNLIKYHFTGEIRQIINESFDKTMDMLGLKNVQTDLQKNTREVVDSISRALFFYSKSILKGQGDFQKAMFVTTFHTELYSTLDKKSNKDLKEWAELECESINKILSKLDSSLLHYSRNKTKKIYGKSKPFYKYCTGNSLEKLIGFKVFQLNLFKNLHFEKKEIQRFNFIKEYVDGLFDIGILSHEADSFSFNWPSISGFFSNETLLNDNSKSVFESFSPETPLKAIGYTVGKNGKSRQHRRMLIDNFYGGNTWIEKYIDDSWGSPKSPKRLEKMVYHLYYQIINKRKQGYKEAVSDWIDDLQFLKKKYYKHESVMKFNFPDDFYS